MWLFTPKCNFFFGDIIDIAAKRLTVNERLPGGICSGIKQEVNLLPFRTYSSPLMFAVGTLFMGVLIWVRRDKYHLKLWQIILFTIALAAVGYAGVRLLAILEQFKALIQGDIAGGMSFYGSVFLIPLLMPLIGKLFKLKPSETLDLCAPCVLAILACMRVSCYATGCCGGIVIYLPEKEFATHPQLIECAADLVLIAILLRKEKKDRKAGAGYPRMLIYYGILRFFLEFIRETPKDILFLSRGQIYALIGVLVGILFFKLFYNKKIKRNTGKKTPRHDGKNHKKHNGGKSR